MNSRQTRARRRAAHRRRTLATLLVIGGTFLTLAIAVFILPGRTLMSGGAPLPPGTHNVKGLATAPVEVEEWSDFQ